MSAAEAREKAREGIKSIGDTQREINKKKEEYKSQQEIIADFDKYYKENYNPSEANYEKAVKEWVKKQTKNVSSGLNDAPITEYGVSPMSRALEIDKAFNIPVDYLSNYEGFSSQLENLLLNNRSAIEYPWQQLMAQQEQNILDAQNALKAYASEYRDIMNSTQNGVVEQMYQEALAGIDFTADNLDVQLNNAGEKLKRDVDAYWDEIQKINNNPEAHALQLNIENAKQKLDANKTQENLDAYNNLVDSWNSTFGQQGYHTFENLNQDYIQSLEDTTTALKDAGDASSETASEIDQMEETMRKRRQAREAAMSGYKEQITDLGDALGNDGTDLATFKKYLESMKNDNAELYNGLREAFTTKDENGNVLQDIIGDIESGKITGKDAIKSMQALRGMIDTIAKEQVSLYDAIDANTTEFKDTSNVQEQIQQLINALIAGGEGLGIQSLFAQFEEMSDEAKASLTDLMPWLADLSEGTISYDEALTLLKENLNGT